jgi:hypothetical protein
MNGKFIAVGVHITFPSIQATREPKRYDENERPDGTLSAGSCAMVDDRIFGAPAN